MTTIKNKNAQLLEKKKREDRRCERRPEHATNVNK